MEYLVNSINNLIPYIKLVITLAVVWVAIVNTLTLVCKIKYRHDLDDLDITKVATSFVMVILCVVVLFIM